MRSTEILGALKETTVKLMLLLCLSSCTPEMQQMGQSILGVTGLVSGSQASTLFTAFDQSSKALSGMSAEQEYYLGRAVSANILGKYPLVNNNALQSYVNRVGMTLAAMSERPETFGGYRFGVFSSPELNAVSGPGGFVFLSSGLVRLLKDEDMLAAVLAHEIAHVVLGHGTDAISTSNFRKAALTIGEGAVQQYGRAEVAILASTFSGSVDDLTKTLLESGYSRRQEYRADRYAVQLMATTGYDPHALLDVLQALKHSKSVGGWTSTHPEPDDRIEEVQSELKSLNLQANPNLRKQRASRARVLSR